MSVVQRRFLGGLVWIDSDPLPSFHHRCIYNNGRDPRIT